MYGAKREIQDGHVIECKHNLTVIYSDCLLSGISVAECISLGASRGGEKGSGTAIFTQPPPLHLFNMLKVPFNK